MDAVIDNPNLSTDQITKVNYYQLFLRVTTIADITTSDGSNIISRILQGKQDQGLDHRIIE
eukprot:6868274-Ditylum_brightwellii.AAC.1